MKYYIFYKNDKYFTPVVNSAGYSDFTTKPMIFLDEKTAQNVADLMKKYAPYKHDYFVVPLNKTEKRFTHYCSFIVIKGETKVVYNKKTFKTKEEAIANEKNKNREYLEEQLISVLEKIEKEGSL